MRITKYPTRIGASADRNDDTNCEDAGKTPSSKVVIDVPDQPAVSTPSNVTSSNDIAAFTEDTNAPAIEKKALTESERNDELLPKPLVKIVNYQTGEVIQASLAQLNQQMRGFHKVILLIEDQAIASDVCTEALHELGYDGVQLITHLMEAEQHLDDIVSNLTKPPAAIVLDLGLGADSGFAVLRKCYSEPKLRLIPILVWTKHANDLAKTFSDYLGAQEFLVKSNDEHELREALKRLLVVHTESVQLPQPPAS